MGSHTTLSICWASTKSNDKVRLNLDVKNLFDRDYEEGAFGNVYAYPGAPRTFRRYFLPPCGSMDIIPSFARRVIGTVGEWLHGSSSVLQTWIALCAAVFSDPSCAHFLMSSLLRPQLTHRSPTVGVRMHGSLAMVNGPPRSRAFANRHHGRSWHSPPRNRDRTVSGLPGRCHLPHPACACVNKCPRSRPA